MLRLDTTLCLAMAAVTACASPAPRSTVPIPTAADDAAREQTADQQVRQVLNRLAFGARPGDYERVRAMGVDRWIAQQLEPQRIDDHAVDTLLAHFPTLSMSPAELMRDYPRPAQLLRQRRDSLTRAGRRKGADSASASRALPFTSADSMAVRRTRRRRQRVLGELQTAKMVSAVASNRQLEDVMVDFWENHFNVFAGKGGPELYYLSSFERDAIRPHALGHFRDLLEAVAKSPAMLYYLDNWQSTVDSGRPRLSARSGGRAMRAGRLVPRFPLAASRNPSAQRAKASRTRGINENYARELMELHTLGVDGGYTQQDVINVARALTGWSIQAPRQGGGFIFRPQMHDAGVKVVLGDTLPAGRGIEDGEEVLDILAHHPSTAHFISMELVRRFVSDSPPPALVERAAETFTRTDGDIREVLRTIFYSPEFFSRQAYKAKVKSPFELVASALRAVGAEPDTTMRAAQMVARLGEPLYQHRDPNGYPETGDAWINTGSILNRINFGLALAAGRMPGVSLATWEQSAKLADAPHDQQVDAVIADILGGEASPDTRKVLESGVNPLLGTQGSGLGNCPGDKGMCATSRSRAPSPEPRVPSPESRAPSLPRLLGLALGAPEFQRR